MRQGLVDKSSGRLHSVASAITDYDAEVYDLVDVPDGWPETARWDETAREFIVHQPRFLCFQRLIRFSIKNNIPVSQAVF